MPGLPSKALNLSRPIASPFLVNPLFNSGINVPLYLLNVLDHQRSKVGYASFPDKLEKNMPNLGPKTDAANGALNVTGQLVDNASKPSFFLSLFIS